MDMQNVNRNLRDAMFKQMDGLVGSLFAVVRFVGENSLEILANGIMPRDWHVVEVGKQGNNVVMFPRAAPDDAFNGGYDLGPWLEIMGINMMGDVNMPHTWAASGHSLTSDQRAANWNTARAHAQALRNGAPQISGWEGAAKLSEAIQRKHSEPVPAPSYTAQSLADEILARESVGLEKYGTTVDGNPLPAYAWHQHGVEEALDLAMYLRRGQRDARDAAMLVETLFAILMDGDDLNDCYVQCSTPGEVTELNAALRNLRALFPAGA